MKARYFMTRGHRDLTVAELTGSLATLIDDKGNVIVSGCPLAPSPLVAHAMLLPEPAIIEHGAISPEDMAAAVARIQVLEGLLNDERSKIAPLIAEVAKLTEALKDLAVDNANLATKMTEAHAESADLKKQLTAASGSVVPGAAETKKGK